MNTFGHPIRLIALVTTVGHADDARRLADAAIEHRLAACVHIEAITSVYRWQGAVQHDDEQRLTFKTTAAAAPALKALILEQHPYELPALVAFEVADASAAYAAWVEQETNPNANPDRTTTAAPPAGHPQKPQQPTPGGTAR